MSLLEQHIRQLSQDGVRINIWPTERGFQANVSERAGHAWTCHTDADPVQALAHCLRLRAARVPDREIVASAEPEVQVERETLIARMPGSIDGDVVEVYRPNEIDPFADILG